MLFWHHTFRMFAPFGPNMFAPGNLIPCIRLPTGLRFSIHLLLLEVFYGFKARAWKILTEGQRLKIVFKDMPCPHVISKLPAMRSYSMPTLTLTGDVVSASYPFLWSGFVQSDQNVVSLLFPDARPRA